MDGDSRFRDAVVCIRQGTYREDFLVYMVSGFSGFLRIDVFGEGDGRFVWVRLGKYRYTIIFWGRNMILRVIKEMERCCFFFFKFKVCKELMW